MNGAFKTVLGVVAALALSFSLLTTAHAQEEQFQQIKLTDAHMKGYIAANNDLSELAKKIEAAGDKPDPKLMDQLEALAKKYGFASYEELDTVIANVSYMLSGFDDKGNFTDPSAALATELEQAKADTSIKKEDKDKMIQEIEEALKATPKLKYTENIEVVKKYVGELDKLAQ